MANGYITNSQHLQDWFEKAGGKKWNLYHRFQTGNLGGGNLIYRQSDDGMSDADSFSLLLEMIEMNTGQGADFTVFVPGNERGNQGFRVFYRSGVTGSLAGIPGQQHNGSQVGYVPAEKVADAVEIAMLRRDVEDMKAAGSPSGFGAIVMERLAENPATIEALASAAIGLLNIAAAKMAGLPMQMQGQGMPTVSGPPNTTTATAEMEIDGDRCNAALGRIACHFPNLEVFLETLAGWVEQNPIMAQSIFQNQKRN